MPLRSPNLQTTLGFCQWYRTSNSTPTEFSINSFGVKLISQRLKQKVTERSKGKRVRVPGLGEFIVVNDSEVTGAGSPRFEGDIGAEAPAAASGGVGTNPYGICRGGGVGGRRSRCPLQTKAARRISQKEGSEEASSLRSYCYCRGQIICSASSRSINH